MRETAGVLDVTGTPIHYWLAGHPRAPLVAFTHAAAMDHATFDAQLQPVWDLGYRTLRWDIRGHGSSRPSGKTPLTLSTLTGDLLALLDKVLLGRQVSLVGHGLGGVVSQLVKCERPDRVSALVVVGSRCLTRRTRPWTLPAATTSALFRRLHTVNTLRHRVARAAAIVPAVQTYAFTSAERLGRRALVALDGAARATVPLESGHHIQAPVLVTHGEHDSTRGLARAAATWAERDAHCWYEVIGRAGHHAHQDNPDAFNRLLLAFLVQHVPVPRGIPTSGLDHVRR